LERTIRAYLSQTYPADRVEIIIVDNGSTDNSVRMIQQYSVKLLSIATPKNPYVCRNAGMLMASHDCIVLNDATCVPNGIYLEELVKAKRIQDADLVVGDIEFEVGEKPTLGEIVDSLHFMRNHEYLSTRKTFPGGSMFFTKALTAEVGMFREDMRSGPDFLWTRRVFDAEKTVVYAPAAQVLYEGTQFPSLWRKAYRDGWAHGTMAREDGRFNWLNGIWRMRPPGPGYLGYIMRTRGKPEYKAQVLRIWVGLWGYRIVYNIGRLHLGSGSY
jgi:glycosyltransferase involved in cell wall biosynthesis